MLTVTYDDYHGKNVVFANEAPYYYLSHNGFDGVDAEAMLAKAPYQKGKTHLGVNIDQRLVTVKCCLVTESMAEYEERRRELLRVLSPLMPGRLTVQGETFCRQFPNVQIVDAPAFSDADYNSPDGIVFFSFTCVVPGNFIEDAYLSERTLSEVVPAFEFVLEFADDIIFGDMSNGRTVVINDGDVEMPLIMEIRGPVDTPMITNETTGDFIRVHTPIMANERMVINTAYGNKSVEIVDDNGQRRNAFHYIDLDSSFFQLIAGENSLRFRAEEGNDTAAISIYYRRLYLGI